MLGTDLAWGAVSDGVFIYSAPPNVGKDKFMWNRTEQ